MTPINPVTLPVYPDDCDSYGHVNQAAFLRMFERARWDVLAQSPTPDAFSRSSVWPAVRKTAVEYYTGAFPGDRLRFDLTLTHLGKTSYSVHQTARHQDGTLAAAADFVFVCIDPQGRPVAVPDSLAQFLGTRPSVPPETTQHIVVRGITQAVEITGDGPPVLLVHGFPLDRSMWRHQVAGLPGYRRIAPDLRGLGLSTTSNKPYKMAEYADDLAGLLEKLEIANAVVCGLSMGGYIAFELWRRHPQRVRALVLANTRADPDTPEGRAGRDKMIQQVGKNGSAAIADAMIQRLLGPRSLGAMPRVVEHVRTMIGDNAPGGVVGALTAIRDRADSTPLLASITVPTLVIAGEDDALIPVASSQAMAAAIPGARFELIADAGHLAPLEQPIATTRLLMEFLNQLDGRPGPA